MKIFGYRHRDIDTAKFVDEAYIENISKIVDEDECFIHTPQNESIPRDTHSYYFVFKCICPDGKERPCGFVQLNKMRNIANVQTFFLETCLFTLPCLQTIFKCIQNKICLTNVDEQMCLVYGPATVCCKFSADINDSSKTLASVAYDKGKGMCDEGTI